MFHKRLMKEFKDNHKLVAGMVVTQWVTLLANASLIYGTALFIQSLMDSRGAAQGVLGFVAEMSPGSRTVCLLGLLLVVMAMRAAMTALNSKWSFAAASRVKSRLRSRIFEKLMAIGGNYREYIPSSEAVQVSTEGVEQLEIYFGKYVPQFFYSLLPPLTLFAIVGTMSMKVAAVLLICVPLIPVSIVAVQKFARRLLDKYWGTYTELGDSFLENLQGLTTLKIYQADERYAQKMDAESEKFRKVTMKVLIMQLNSISVMDLVAYGGAAAGILLSLMEFRAGHLAFAQCFFIIMVSAEFFLPLRLLGSFFHIAMNGNAAANKIFALLDKEVPKKGALTWVPGSDVCFDNVSFGYTDTLDVLSGIRLHMPEKSFTALVGASGCGKSTLAALLMGDHKNYSGSVRIGGVDVRDIAEEMLYRKMTRIRHDSYLFKGTVADNLRMGNGSATDTQLYDVLKQVDLYDTVMEKGGLSMTLQEKAANLSGGQRQRLALARALLHDSDIYIFDEATSNIDAESENKIMSVIRSLTGRKTILLISHRLANVAEADQIFVLKDGHIIEQGDHGELCATDGYYEELYESQRALEAYGSREADGVSAASGAGTGRCSRMADVARAAYGTRKEAPNHG